jgi:hypothetical protein
MPRRCGTSIQIHRTRAACTAASRKAALETLKLRFALGIDLAAIELLTLVLVAEDFVRHVQFGKAFRRFGVALVGIGVVLLGELAVSALDRRSTGTPLHPQDLIGVAHPSGLLAGN